MGLLDRILFHSVASPRRRYRLIEALLWTGIAIALPFVLSALETGESGQAFFLYTLYSAAILVFLLVYQLIFGSFPLEHLRWLASARTELRSPVPHPREDPFDLAWEGRQIPDVPEDQREPAEKLLIRNALASRDISKGMYNRAGVYLLIGVVIAFTGMALFLFSPPTISIDQSGMDTAERSMTLYLFILSYIPRLGIFLFIELIAFFFLRQYRAAMDEFRYFEGIKRRREEVLVLHAMAKEANGDPLELLRMGAFFSDAAPLSQGQTTELIEARKLEKNEIALLEKMIEAITLRRP